ncbi:MAG: hypothetical protein R3242_10825 [Akkermansiaceae bacterium]|nr:hypothetical protein [Akkermansiaceae bacterium]
MKTITLLTIAALAIPVLPALGQPGHRKAHRHGLHKANIGKNAAMREEQLLDHVDTHKWKKDPEAMDRRSTVLSEYHNHTLRRIVALLRHGALGEEKGKEFKEIHTVITERGKELNADGKLSETEKQELRGRLNELNDDITASIQDAEQGDQRTPLFNQTQHRFEEQIEFGVRSGRLSKGEASSLTRKVEKLKRLEDREKAGGLSSREREKMFEEAAELARDIHRQLQD